MTLDDRFWAKVNKTDTCWLWTASKLKSGYGSLWDGRKSEYAHRVSWILAFGDLPQGLLVLHRCDVRLCVNPEHLFLGNQNDNVQDMIAKGRAKFGASPCLGSKHGCARLTEKEVREIRAMAGSGETGFDLARIYGVSYRNVRSIVARETWRHVE